VHLTIPHDLLVVFDVVPLRVLFFVIQHHNGGHEVHELSRLRQHKEVVTCVTSAVTVTFDARQGNSITVTTKGLENFAFYIGVFFNFNDINFFSVNRFLKNVNG